MKLNELTSPASGKDRFISITEVMARTSLSRSYIYALVKRGDMPRPVKLGDKCSRWSEHAVDSWLAAKMS